VRTLTEHQSGDFMPAYTLGNLRPHIAASAYLAPNATVLGNVVLAEQASVWFGATIRGDNEEIRIGEGSNIQDGAVLHTDPGFPMSIEAHVSVGHQAMLHGCTVGEGSLIGIQAILLNGAKIGKGCLVAAGAVVTEGKSFPDNSLILGVPAKLMRELSVQERGNIRKIAENYAARAEHYRVNLQPL
jgi:carbonic anhydrase/acetyltransferase-like protein (isoleucine patch superfamily)